VGAFAFTAAELAGMVANANQMADFQAINENNILVLGSNGNLWLEHGPFGVAPPSRQQVDGNVRLPTA
jgi:hypothetical protein